MFACVVCACVCLGDFRGTLLVSSPLVRGLMFRLDRIREDPPPRGLQIHGSVWHAAQHRRVRGEEKLGTIVAWMAAERDEWRRRGSERWKQNGRKEGGWFPLKGKQIGEISYSYSPSSRCDQSDRGGRQRPARLACSGNKAKLRDKRDDRVTHSRRMGKPTAPLTLYSHRGADTEDKCPPTAPLLCPSSSLKYGFGLIRCEFIKKSWTKQTNKGGGWGLQHSGKIHPSGRVTLNKCLQMRWNLWISSPPSSGNQS